MKNFSFSGLLKLTRAHSHFIKALGFSKFALLSIGTGVFAVFSLINIIALLPAVGVLTGKEIVLGGFNLTEKITLVSNSLNFPPHAVVACAILATFLLKFISSNIFAYTSGYYTELYMNFLRKAFQEKAYEKIRERKKLDLADLSNILMLISKIGSLNWSFLNFIVKLLFSIISIAFLLKINPIAVGVFAIIGLSWTTLLIPLFKYTRRSSEKYLQDLKELNQLILENVSTFPIFYVFQKIQNRTQMFYVASNNLQKSNANTSILRQSTMGSQEFILAIGVSFLLFGLDKMSLNIEMIISFGFLIAKLAGSMNEAIISYSNALEMLPAFIEIEQIGVSLSSENLQKETNIKIHLENLEYKNFIPEGLKIKPLTLKLFPGDRIKIAGPNGIGKSTLVSAFAGIGKFSGEIWLNNEKLHGDLPSRVQISVATQDAILFRGTLLENIFFENIQIEKLENFLKTTHFKIEEIFNDWKNFRISENGSNLSGGQRQIISLLRGILADSDILFLDEYSNHLSTNVKEAFFRYIDHNMSNKVIIYVSHENILDFTNQKIVDLERES